jgi:hypothetical protein
MRTEAEIRAKIADIEIAVQPFVEEQMLSPMRLMRAQIKGLKYALGEDYNIEQGK